MGQYQQKTPEFLIEYVKRISTILQDDFIAAKLYGSFARGEQTDDSDIDIVIFTKKTQDQYISLMKKIVDVTMEYNDKQHFTTFTPPQKLTKLVYTRPELSPLDFLRFGP